MDFLQGTTFKVTLTKWLIISGVTGDFIKMFRAWESDMVSFQKYNEEVDGRWYTELETNRRLQENRNKDSIIYTQSTRNL